MGVNIDMEYIIMGNDVILTEYKSSNKNLLLPKCITSLGDNSVEVDKNTKIPSHIRYIGGGNIVVAYGCKELSNNVKYFFDSSIILCLGEDIIFTEYNRDKTKSIITIS